MPALRRGAGWAKRAPRRRAARRKSPAANAQSLDRRTILAGSYVESSVYMPGARAEFKLVGNLLSADVTTASEQNSTQAGYSLPHQIHFRVALPRDPTSTLGGFGFQFTGTASAGNRTELERVQVTLTPR
jgi:hypothetical protein